jgi:branched-chain amino acid transport system ATP-binding protein
MGDPKLILIDEPTEGLAPLLVQRVNETISEIHNQGMTVLLVEQKLPVCLNLATKIYVMSKGTIQWNGSPRELGQREDIRKQYLEV